MRLKHVTLNYNREINKIPRKELIRDLEKARFNYLQVEGEYLKNFDTNIIKDQVFSDSTTKVKFAEYINILKRKGRLSFESAGAIRHFLRSLRKVVPTKSNILGERQLQYYIDLQTKELTEKYLAMSNRLDSKAGQQISDIIEHYNITPNMLRQFLKSHKNVDLSHVELESDGLEDFEEEYGVSLPVARFMDFFGLDYTDYYK